MGTYTNIKGIITRIDEIGTGLVSPITPIGAHSKDVFFNKKVLDESISWSQLSVGLDVELPIVVSKNGNLYAERLKLPVALVENKEKWLEVIINKIGVAQYSRLEDHIYENRYRKVIKDLNDEHSRNVRNLCLFLGLILLSFLYLNLTERNYDSIEDRPEKSDYSPYGGWTYE